MSDEAVPKGSVLGSWVKCPDPECPDGHQHWSYTEARDFTHTDAQDFISNKVSHIEERAYPSYDEVRAFMNRGIIPISDIVAPDAPTTVNAKGGAQSEVPVRFDLIDAKAMFEMAKVLDHGAKKYGANNWRLIDVDDHLNHLLMHTFAYLAGDDTDDHLSHILCRATFALGVKLAEQGVDNGKVD